MAVKELELSCHGQLKFLEYGNKSYHNPESIVFTDFAYCGSLMQVP